MNGVPISGAIFPRGAVQGIGISPVSYEANRGGYSGVELVVLPFSPHDIHSSILSTNLDLSALQLSNQSPGYAGERHTRISVDGVHAGPLFDRRAHYNLSYQLRRNAYAHPGILDATPTTLQHLGIDPDSIARLFTILDSLHIPVRWKGDSKSMIAEDASIMASLASRDPLGSTTGFNPAYGIYAIGQWAQQGGFPQGMTATPATGARSVSRNGTLQGQFSFYGGPLLHSWQFTGVRSMARTEPHLRMPAGYVTLQSGDTLPSSLQRFACVGDAVPAIDWQSFTNPALIPTRCANGSIGTVFSDTVPSAQVFGTRYTAPRSWRSVVEFYSWVSRYTLYVQGLYSRNMGQADVHDLNMQSSPQFVLATEGNRAVYVPSASIVEANGTTASQSARMTNRVGPVLEHRSDLRSVARQLTIQLIRTSVQRDFERLRHQWASRLEYSIASVRDQIRGGPGTRDGAATGISWGRSSGDIRHTINARLSYNSKRISGVLTGSLKSGTPYTPLVSGDINGDGLTNDRAFVFDPRDASGDHAKEMQTLLARTPQYARQCLERQIGRIAERNSCRSS